ncbi:MAG TPA: glycosyltransferase family 1 protein [Ilumatobacteraceae bacterium]|nr:glycosyltransferase family 1 protein [Ilumatobacteraceae bacterium]
MLRVAIDVGPTHGRRTGIGNAVAWTVDALAEREGIDLRRYVTSARARLGTSERRIPMPAAMALRLWAHRSAPMDRWLDHPEVVHGTNYVVPPTRCARVVSVYDCWFLEHPEDAEPDVLRAAAVLRRAVADGAHVVTSSDATTRRVRTLLDTDRVRTVLLGAPPAEPDEAASVEPLGLPQLSEFVLALGTIERRKNLPTLVDAFGRLAREHASVRLVIAGAAGNDVAAVDRAIARLSPETAERVVRTGIVDDATKRWLLTHARALVYPSLDEGFGFPILEAQQAGTPVVASTAGSIPQIAGAAALLSPARDAEALAANLYWIVTNDGMHAKLVRRGHANVARFSWASTAAQYHQMYRELAEHE